MGEMGVGDRKRQFQHTVSCKISFLPHRRRWQDGILLHRQHIIIVVHSPDTVISGVLFIESRSDKLYHMSVHLSEQPPVPNLL